MWYASIRHRSCRLILVKDVASLEHRSDSQLHLATVGIIRDDAVLLQSQSERANRAPYDEGVYSLLDTTASFDLRESVGITKNGLLLVASFYLLACESGPAPT